MQVNPNIMVVEDDEDIGELVLFNLDKEGYRTRLFTNGDTAFEEINKQPPDLLILDLNLPGLSGIEICKYLRENARTKNLPVIMLTARTQEIDKVIGFQIGADDYITKPFSVRELVARIQALLRRSMPSSFNIFQLEELTIFLDMHRILCNEQEVNLTPKEYKLLEALVNARGRVLSRSDLLEIVWGYDFYGDTRTVDVHIKRMRDKLGSCAGYIETVKGTGYRLKTI
ncbi:MAG: response regulator transcription factor [Calditrichia bacterium]